jgi:hypothetical protein
VQSKGAWIDAGHADRHACRGRNCRLCSLVSSVMFM